MNDTTLETVGGLPTLRFTRLVPAARSDVWRAVSEPGVVAEWFLPGRPWTRATELDQLLGVTESAPVASVPQSHVTWQREESVFTFGLTDHEGGTRVELLVTIEDRDEAAVAALEIGSFLDRLAPYLAGDELNFAAFADVDAQERRLEEYAERFGVDRTRGLDYAASVRQALAAGESDVRSDYEPAPDAAELMEAAMVSYLREHQDELQAAEARRGTGALKQTLERVNDWILPAVRTTPEFVARYFFVMDRFIAGGSLALDDLESAWTASHPA